MRPTTPAALLAAVALLAGCSPSSPEAVEAAGITDARAEDPVIPTGPGGAISIEAGDLFFQNLTGQAVDGAVAVTIVNIGDAEHNIRIDAAAGEEVKVTALGGETTEGELLLFGSPSGQEYTYYCDIPGHRAAGMEGELFVYATPEQAAEEPLFPGQEMTAEEAPADEPTEEPAEEEAPAEEPTEEEAPAEDATEEAPAEESTEESAEG